MTPKRDHQEVLIVWGDLFLEVFPVFPVAIEGIQVSATFAANAVMDGTRDN